MLTKLGSLGRHVVGNRRRHPRRRMKYDTIVCDEIGREVFRGFTTDLSRSGARIAGFPAGLGISEGQQVRVEFLLLPKDCTKVANRAPVTGRVVRVEETADRSTVAVAFHRPLPG